ncbi:MAG: hypothetical protein MUF34_23230 [Polyangiaceae bacterium]|nr:hypothetical protein [Polyangiaceae bacterium]
MSCDPAIARDAWSPRPDGTACAAGQICEASACVAKCLIGGVFYAADAANPANDCQQCDPAVSTTDWSPRALVTLLVGGVDISTQGWSTVGGQPNSLTYGPDYVRVATSTTAGASTSGALLLVRPAAYDAAQPFRFRVEALVESASPHNPFDSGAAILGAFTAPFGNGAERAQMVFLDGAAVGWADNSQSAPVAVLNQYRTYELSIEAGGVARFRVDGVALLTRNNFAANGTIAIGDQTNDSNVDGVMRIRSVSKVCP